MSQSGSIKGGATGEVFQEQFFCGTEELPLVKDFYLSNFQDLFHAQ